MFNSGFLKNKKAHWRTEKVHIKALFLDEKCLGESKGLVGEVAQETSFQQNGLQKNTVLQRVFYSFSKFPGWETRGLVNHQHLLRQCINTSFMQLSYSPESVFI